MPKTIKLASLKPNPDNPRYITEDKFEALKRSIRDFPDMMALRPLVVDEQGTVLGGNMRLKALAELGYQDIPAAWVIKAKDLTEDQRREFVIKDNIGFGAWDWDIIANEWSDLPLEDWGLDVWEPEEEAKAKVTEDEVPEPPTEPITKPGDLWILGEHRLLCGDSTKAEDVERLMDGAKAVLLHADPPYGMGKEKDGIANDNLYSDKLDRFQMKWWTAFRPHLEDNASAYIWGNAPDLWRLWYCGGLGESETVTMRNEIIWNKGGFGAGGGTGVGQAIQRSYFPGTERCVFFMLGEQGFNNNADNYWEGWEPIRSYIAGEMKKCGWTTADLNRITGTQMAGHWVTKSQWGLITAENYNKIQQAAQKHDAFKREHDALKREHDALKREFYATRAYFDNTHDNMTDVWQFDRVKGEDRHGHATPKPVQMLSRVIKSSSPQDAVVVSPFGGTGPDFIAAEQLGRKCYGMEISPQYCDVIVKRWETLTGKKAKNDQQHPTA